MPNPPNVFVSQHPLVQHKRTLMRSVEPSRKSSAS